MSRYPDDPFTIPEKIPTPATPSFRRRPESSGLFNPFPRSGNGNERNNKPVRASDKTCRLFTPRRHLPGCQPSPE